MKHSITSAGLEADGKYDGNTPTNDPDRRVMPAPEIHMTERYTPPRILAASGFLSSSSKARLF